MKRYCLFLLLMLLCAFNSNAQLRSTKDLIGKWESNEVKLEFFADGRVGLVMPGGTMPGATYKADFFKMPAVLDIIVTQGRQKITSKAFIKFINNTTLEMEGFDENDPAAAFMKGRTVILKKSH